MCDFFGGDLADVVRSVSFSAAAGPTSTNDVVGPTWNFPAAAGQLSTDDFVPSAAGGPGDDDDSMVFGLRDPLLHELTGTTAAFYDGDVSADQQQQQQPPVKRPACGLFSRVLQISPAPHSPRAPAGDVASPRPPGIKRRKSQAKKVVCIPAPAAASSRPSGEVVPSDLWAWRKYGQKPIKGSPYPRGYYRCSSSKGCSARKQVERSRTDPNMLVITYTSEHNHPWPTQRNALAGSTRSQPSKNNTAKSTSPNINNQRLVVPKEEPNNTTTPPTLVKEEVAITGQELTENINTTAANAEMADDVSHEFECMFYNEAMMGGAGANQSAADDFFADLAELEPDPMSLIFSGKSDHEDHDQKERNKLGLMDPFINMFDWGGSSFGEYQSKKGL